MKYTNVNLDFWQKKRVFITGHTGFKGSWLSLWLTSMGAEVAGYAMPPSTNPNLFDALNLKSLINTNVYSDIRDLSDLKKTMSEFAPQVVIHMAAQPLVRFSYSHPVETYETNVVGTVNLLEATRSVSGVKAVIVVTTDKCYENKEWLWGYRENDALGGADPYSSSKACAELVTAAYRQSFFSTQTYATHGTAIASARAGNVIGGGDWSEDRLIPDLLRAKAHRTKLVIRNPNAKRPWQHVLEPLAGYLMLAERLYEFGPKYAAAWNFGPNDGDAVSVANVLRLIQNIMANMPEVYTKTTTQPHEYGLLKLDNSEAKNKLNWFPKWNLEQALNRTLSWHDSFDQKQDMIQNTLAQIKEYSNYGDKCN
jgi:CDP-glucose 4,6-dehydratase